MADKKISQLTSATTPLDGTEVLPIVQSSATVKVANNDLRPKQIQSNATSGVLQVTGPAASTTRVMTTPNANFTVARTDAAQTFSGDQTFNNNISLGVSVTSQPLGNVVQVNGGVFVGKASANDFWLGSNWYYNGGDKYINNGFGSLYSQQSGKHVWWTAPSGTAGAAMSLSTIMESDTSGNFTFNIGNLVQGTAAKGINFTANTAASGMTSQLLNWYEEGTWTPTVQFGTGNTGMTVTTSGRYTRIGRTVNISVNIEFTAKGTSTGNFRFDLPFATGAKASGSMGFNYSWATMPTGGITFMADGNYVYGMPANIGGYIDDTYFNNGTTIQAITITYTV